MAVKKSSSSSSSPRRAGAVPSSRRSATTPSPRRASSGKFTSKKPVVTEEVDEELESSAVSVEAAPEPEPEEVEEEETDELDEDEEGEEYDEEEEDGEEYEDEEDDDSISEETRDALVGEMEKGLKVQPEPVNIRRLTIAEIKLARDITEEPFFVEDWGGDILIKSPSARQIMNMVKNSGQGSLKVENGRPATDDVDFDVMMKDLIQMSVVDPPIDDEGYEILMDKAAGPVMEIFGKIREVAKLDRISASGKKVDAVKEEEKNFRKG